MRRIRHLLLAALVAVLVVTGTDAPLAGASVFEAGPSEAVVAGFEHGRFFAEVVGIDGLTVSDTGVVQESVACIRFGLLDGTRVDEACGPVAVNIDPFLHVGHVQGTLDSLLGEINVDLTVTGTGAPSATFVSGLDGVVYTSNVSVSRVGEVTGTIGSTALGAIGSTEGSSWYGQLVKEQAGRVALP